MVAPGTAAPEGSSTVPFKLPGGCANSAADIASTKNTPMTARLKKIIPFPCCLIPAAHISTSAQIPSTQRHLRLAWRSQNRFHAGQHRDGHNVIRRRAYRARNDDRLADLQVRQLHSGL